MTTERASVPPELHAAELGAVFGSTPATTPDDAARLSTRRFVRSQIGLAFDSETATGLTMTAEKALTAFGWETLRLLADKPAVGIVQPGYDAASVLPAARRRAGLSRVGLVARAGVSLTEIDRIEQGRGQVPIATLARIATALGLCPIRFGAVESDPSRYR